MATAVICMMYKTKVQSHTKRHCHCQCRHMPCDTTPGIHHTESRFHSRSVGTGRLQTYCKHEALHCDTSCSLLLMEMLTFVCSPGSLRDAFACSFGYSFAVWDTVQIQEMLQKQLQRPHSHSPLSAAAHSLLQLSSKTRLSEEALKESCQ